MKFIFVVLLVLQIKLMILSVDAKEHVHFKIHVPEIIKHHVHTRTIFIHLHEPKKKAPPKKNEYVESHQDDWSIWSSYSNYGADHGSRHEEDELSAIRGHQEDGRGGPRVHPVENYQGYVAPHGDSMTAPGPPPPLPIDNAYPSYYRSNANPSIPHYDDYQKNYQNYQHVDGQNPVPPAPLPMKSVFRNGITGYSYPPQYEIHENVVEDGPDNSLESYKNSHEEGHSKRLHEETGHLYTNELENYYDDKREEASESVSTESQEVEDSNNDGYRFVGSKYHTSRRMTR